jgi:acyl-CoA synthetase (AMP-forming)/AMP-acid ligase II
MSAHAETRVSSHQLPGHLIRVLRRHADERPRQPACVHLLDGEAEHANLTYSQLDRRARAIAARLQDMGLAGQSVLLVYPPGLDFISAFFGCLYAGCVAVPTYPPHRHRMLEHFRAVPPMPGPTSP